MKKTVLAVAAILLLTLGLWWGLSESGGRWAGVDKTVVEKYAKEAGREPEPPVINTDQGDLLLFMFLLAGAAGGFVGGYYFRELFPPEGEDA
jgi:hypothetical protein